MKQSNPDLVVGVIGCMAERLRTKLMGEKSQGVGKSVDLIVGPDEYRKLPELVANAWHGEKGVAVKLSRVETYDDILPLRTDGISAWLTVMRGCDKFCTFCVVPFTRGRERSRTLASIVREVEVLSARGFKEVTLLGQNVNSYRDGDQDFSDLLRSVAEVDRTIRVRFTTSHPQDMSDKLIETIAGYSNICNFVHLPVQSGSDRILQLMNRTYNISHYLRLVEKVRNTIPDVALSTDIIAGFPTETEEDHQTTVNLLKEVGYDGAFMFKYSPREGTPAFSMGDHVSDEVKSRRVTEIVDLQTNISLEKNRGLIGQTFTVVVEGESKKSKEELTGRTDTNKSVVFPPTEHRVKIGDYLQVKIHRVNSATLFGSIVDGAVEEEKTAISTMIREAI